MKRNAEPLVVGNWKMNPQNALAAKHLATDIKKAVSRIDGVTVVIAPPALFIPLTQVVQNGSNAFLLGAQNVHHEQLGPHTGELSITMLKSFGVEYVIIGHSERRGEGESDAQIHAKLVAVVKSGLRALLCVGERVRDHSAHYLNEIEQQIRLACNGIPRSKLESLTIAYEPVWAIGTGDNAASSDIHEMRLFIEKILTDLYGRNYAQKVQILYGGSVTGKNAQTLMQEGMIDGFLVGGASLRADEFVDIVKAAKKAA